MGWLVYLLLLAVQGLVVGAFARLALPGKDPMTIPQTLAVGLAGTFIAGVITYALTGGDAAPGFLIALAFAAIIVYFVRRARGGGLTDPGRPRGER